MSISVVEFAVVETLSSPAFQSGSFQSVYSIKIISERCGCEGIETVWIGISDSLSEKYMRGETPLSGSRTYAVQKAHMYKRMASDFQKHFLKDGGRWPSADEIFSEHVPGAGGGQTSP